MDLRSFNQNQVQYDYFSDNYQRFEEDFYQFSKLEVPLSFIEDDLLRMMSAAQINYFRIPASQAKDQQGHTFVFKVHSDPKNPLLRIYRYQHHYIT